jgi:hypothetical protein
MGKKKQAILTGRTRPPSFFVPEIVKNSLKSKDEK